MKRLFIISTKAGSVKNNKLIDELKDFYQKLSDRVDFRIIETQNKLHAKNAARSFVQEEGDDKIIYCCGGDGTLNEIAVEVAGSTTALGLIPMGTANDFSKNFDYTNFRIENTLAPVVQAIDMIQVNQRLAINIMSMGFDTMILKRTYALLQKFPSLKQRAFILAAIYSVLKLECEDLEVTLETIDGKILHLKDQYNIIALCNGGFYGNGFHPSPHANLKDGVLELILAKKLGFFEFLSLISKYKNGTHLDNPKIDLYQVVKGTILTKRQTPANCDGELFENNTFHFEILPKHIKWAFIAPPVEP